MIRSFIAATLLTTPVWAETPRVMTDIAPVHSLVALVMGDLGAPDLLLSPGADPHDFALRPSDAQALGDADIVFWVGEGLTPWLGQPLETLAGGATHVSLLDTEGWTRLDIRAAGNHDHGHDEHKDEAHEDHGHDDHEHGDAHAHDHGDFDPHAWTDPAVAQVWVAAIADALAAADPENAATYAANAKTAVTALAELDEEIAISLEGLADRAYVLPHDGYQYFETRYGLAAQASISGIDAATPGPAQIAEIRDQMADQGVVCVFNDAEIGERWASLVIEGTDARTAQIDAVGSGLEAGPDLYRQMMLRLAGNFDTCLRGLG